MILTCGSALAGDDADSILARAAELEALGRAKLAHYDQLLRDSERYEQELDEQAREIQADQLADTLRRIEEDLAHIDKNNAKH